MTKLSGERVLVTGASGSIGSALVDELLMSDQPEALLATDIGSMDVSRRSAVDIEFSNFMPTLIFHLAGAKHAPLGEEDPVAAAAVNIIGTRNVLEYAAKYGGRVVTASTCKACNPETAYGATKLIAERITLNAGGSVARFYNVRESAGNVFETWRNLPSDEPLPVTPCFRRFMGIGQAVRLLLMCAVLEPGRYSVAGTRLVSMETVAHETYPGRPIVYLPPRRGDRLEEPEYAAQETHDVPHAGVFRVFSPHDEAPVPQMVAA